MSEWNIYAKADEQDAEGNFGVPYWGYRNPDTHLPIIFSDRKADQEPPSQSPEEHFANLATPAAREKAAEEGVDVTSLSGSGKGGKVTATDVEKASS